MNNYDWDSEYQEDGWDRGMGWLRFGLMVVAAAGTCALVVYNIWFV